MLTPDPQYQAKSGSQAEPPEDYCCNLEAPEDHRQEEEEPAANL
jgi:hypothetical protein